MFQKEILIAPLLEPRIILRIVPVAGCFDRAVEVRRVLGVRVAGRQVHAAAKPRSIPFFEKSEIRMNCGRHRAYGMKYKRHARGEKLIAAAQWDFRREFLRQTSVNCRKVHAGLLEHLSFCEHAGSAPTPAFARPNVLTKKASVDFLDRSRNPILKPLQVFRRPIAPVHGCDDTRRTVATGCCGRVHFSMPDIEKYIQSARTEFEARLQEWVEIPTISAEPEHRPDIERGADAAVSYLRSLGAEAEKIPTPGNPVVAGRFITGKDQPTVTVYNHLDVQPANEPQWQRPPFVFHKDGDRYIGRGSTDDKGPALTALFGARYAVEQGTRVNIQFIWELEEEIGSPNFEHFIKRKTKEFRTDSVVVSDTIWISRGRPAVSYGLRGLAPIRLVLETGTRDVHSGVTGGAARNPLTELCQVIAECYDARSGMVQIPGFYDDVVRLTKNELDSFLASGFSVKGFKTANELTKIRSTDARETVHRIWAHPTFEVHGFVGGYTGPGVKTAIPPKAEAKISMRLVPNQNPDKIFKLVRNFIRKRNPDVEVKPESFLRPYIGPNKGPYADAGRDAMHHAFGKQPAFVREGGSIGAVVTMQEYLKAPIVLLGLSLPEHGYHAPNENFDWQQASGGMRMFARYFENISKI